MIKLTGNLDWELRRLGYEVGDKIHHHSKPAENGAIYWTTHYVGLVQNCVVWSDNYEIIQTDNEEA